MPAPTGAAGGNILREGIIQGDDNTLHSFLGSAFLGHGLSKQIRVLRNGFISVHLKYICNL